MRRRYHGLPRKLIELVYHGDFDPCERWGLRSDIIEWLWDQDIRFNTMTPLDWGLAAHQCEPGYDCYIGFRDEKQARRFFLTWL